MSTNGCQIEIDSRRVASAARPAPASALLSHLRRIRPIGLIRRIRQLGPIRPIGRIRRILLAAAAAFGLALAASAANAAPTRARPNILFILADDQSHRTVGCYPEAYPWVRTPHLDRLAANGIRFAPAYIGANCIPARASLLTGLHTTGIQQLRPSQLRTRNDREEAPIRFWPEVFRQNGYHTAQIGKWHTAGGTRHGRDWDYQAVWSRLVGGREHNLNYQLNQLVSFNGAEAKPVPGYSTDNYTKWAVDYIRGENRDPGKPWYLWLCYDAPHGPFVAAERHRDLYGDAPVPAPASLFPPRPGKPAYMQTVETWIRDERGAPVMRPTHYEADAVLKRHRDTHDFPTEYADWVRRYHRAVAAIDDGVGTVVRALEETGQLENTLIVFTSDQGLAVGQHGFFDKHAPYDGNLAAPLIVSMPGTIPAPAVCDVPVMGVDLIPTFFRFAGLDLPWPMHGRDLTPLLRDPSASWPHPAMLIYTIGAWGDDTIEIPDESAPPPPRGFRVPWWVFLRQDRYKYIRTLVPNEIEELYDLHTDPEELTNLALDARYRHRLQRMRAETEAELRRIEAKLVDRLPPVGTPQS